MAKTTGWAPCGARLVDHAPFGHWQTQTFIAALRHDRLDAPWVIGGPINRKFFDLYGETRLAPTLHKGDVLRRENDPPDYFLILLIPDNLATHRSPKAAAVLKDIGAWFLFLPPYSPDLNPPYGDCRQLPVGQRIEMAFAKLRAIRRENDSLGRFLTRLFPKSRSPDLRPTLESRRRRLRHLQGRRVLQILQSCRV